MDCIYYDFDDNVEILEISGEEFFHIKALRIKIGENIEVTNGKGLIGIFKLEYINKNSALLNLDSINYHLLKNKIGLALGILDNRDRFEFALEKTIELGITDFYPIISEHSSKKKYEVNRLINKSIAAIKQSKRPFLPIIHNISNINDILEKELNKYNSLILADISGQQYNKSINNQNNLVFVGPEGGFSDYELNLISKFNPFKVKLGNYRLRAETAAISIISLINNI